MLKLVREHQNPNDAYAVGAVTIKANNGGALTVEVKDNTGGFHIEYFAGVPESVLEEVREKISAGLYRTALVMLNKYEDTRSPQPSPGHTALSGAPQESLEDFIAEITGTSGTGGGTQGTAPMKQAHKPVHLGGMNDGYFVCTVCKLRKRNRRDFDDSECSGKKQESTDDGQSPDHRCKECHQRLNADGECENPRCSIGKEQQESMEEGGWSATDIELGTEVRAKNPRGQILGKIESVTGSSVIIRLNDGGKRLASKSNLLDLGHGSLILREADYSKVSAWWDGMEDSERGSVLVTFLPGYAAGGKTALKMWSTFNDIFRRKLCGVYDELYGKNETLTAFISAVTERSYEADSPTPDESPTPSSSSSDPDESPDSDDDDPISALIARVVAGDDPDDVAASVVGGSDDSDDDGDSPDEDESSSSSSPTPSSSSPTPSSSSSSPTPSRSPSSPTPSSSASPGSSSSSSKSPSPTPTPSAGPPSPAEDPYDASRVGVPPRPEDRADGSARVPGEEEDPRDLAPPQVPGSDVEPLLGPHDPDAAFFNFNYEGKTTAGDAAYYRVPLFKGTMDQFDLRVSISRGEERDSYVLLGEIVVRDEVRLLDSRLHSDLQIDDLRQAIKDLLPDMAPIIVMTSEEYGDKQVAGDIQVVADKLKSVFGIELKRQDTFDIHMLWEC